MRFFSFSIPFVRLESARGYKKKGRRKMRKKEKKLMCVGILMMAAFALWTACIQTVDVAPVGQDGTNIGFATLNCWFHSLTGVHMAIYTITDWLGLVPIGICMLFGVIGLVQLIRRRNICKVDLDLILLGIYYVIVIFGYVIFEMSPEKDLPDYRTFNIRSWTIPQDFPRKTLTRSYPHYPFIIWMKCRR